MQYWKSVFDKYDLDGDGRITHQELKAMLQNSSCANDIPSKTIREILEKADLDGSGFLDYPEFIAMVCIIFYNSLLI